MLEGKAVVRDTDMSEGMQSYVMELAHQALDAHEVSDCQSIAHFIKQMMEFLIFKDGKDFTESREEAIGVLQKATNCDP
ncbi:Dynein light chain 1 [Spatholobus suberectus]|nr:Dynein light chain 1 [Spatholobus suberectus]